MVKEEPLIEELYRYYGGHVPRERIKKTWIEGVCPECGARLMERRYPEPEFGRVLIERICENPFCKFMASRIEKVE